MCHGLHVESGEQPGKALIIGLVEVGFFLINSSYAKLAGLNENTWVLSSLSFPACNRDAGIIATYLPHVPARIYIGFDL